MENCFSLMLYVVVTGLLAFWVVDGSVNLAFSKQTRQSSTITPEWTADKAVDGNRNLDVLFHSCAHTDVGYTEAWWQVDLGIIATISNIQIYYRDHYGKRLLGYYLLVSNSSDLTTGELCYQHEGQRIPSTFQNITCTVTGRYVTVYNFRNQTHVDWGYESEAYLELCEVEVYGCPIGFYGETCDFICSQKCIGSICNPDSALCVLGCNGGWAGPNCNECRTGAYGLNCTDNCGHCKGDNSCHQISGACRQGCQDGWLSPTCTQCRPGRHGTLCTENCGYCFGNTSCDVVTGVCLQGCEYGYTGQHCKQRFNEDNCDTFVNSLVGLLSFLALLMVLSAIALVLISKLYKKQNAGNKNEQLTDNIYAEADDTSTGSKNNSGSFDLHSSSINVDVCSSEDQNSYLYPLNKEAVEKVIDKRHSYLPQKSKFHHSEVYSSVDNVCSGKELEQYLYSYSLQDFGERDICNVSNHTPQSENIFLKRHFTPQAIYQNKSNRLTNISLPATVTMIPSNSDEYLEMTGKIESVGDSNYIYSSNDSNKETYLNQYDSQSI